MARLWWQNRTVLLACAGIVALTFFPGRTEASVIGGNSGDYLRVGVGAAALGMGNAQSASPEYFLPWYNPAALSYKKKPDVAAGVGMRSLGRTDAFVSLGFKIPPRVGMGFFLLYRGDPFLNELHDAQENLLPRASYSTFTAKIALSYYMSRKLSLGGCVSIFYKQLPTSFENDRYYYSSATSIGAVDMSLMYKLNETWVFSAIAKNMGASMAWLINTGDYNPQIDEKIVPVFILSSWHQTAFKQKPLIWTLDINGYYFDGSFKRLDRAEGVLNTGLEWRYWEQFFLRAGISEFLLNGDLLHNRENYFSNFPVKITAGFCFDMSKYRKGLKLNYGISTDKIGAGIDQQLDVQLTF